MRNGVRHLLGAGAGLLATPLIAAGFVSHAGLDGWLATSLLAGLMVVIGALAGSRISPLASLLPGLALAVPAGAFLAGAPWVTPYGVVPPAYEAGYRALLAGWALPVACVLVVASLFPSRWRGAPRPVEPVQPPEPPVQPASAEEPPPLPKRIPSRY
ncbi:hypothetical protein GCM10009733_013660 [Nonomuraea maheshkhaliensis]|uniref:Uncharacterized protein n=1 Tax=Nonomuraea maheshkhaliensis TaxID=419590 RepID=A0ABP4QQB0_9ACTN